MWNHPAAIIAYVTIASAISFWLGARSRVWEWQDGYRAGREDGESAQAGSRRDAKRRGLFRR